MLLMKEDIQDIQILTEGDNSAKVWKVKGIVMQANKLNRNGRIYPKDTLKNECARYIREYVNRNRAYGECGHPNSPKIIEDRISHRITSLVEDGNNWVAEARVIKEGKGKIISSILEDGGQLGASSRALGSLKESNGANIVQSDLRLVTAFDIVIDPSAPDAFINGIMEDKEWVFLNGEWHPQDHDFGKKLIKESRNQADYEKKAAWLMEDFFNKLAN